MRRDSPACIVGSASWAFLLFDCDIHRLILVSSMDELHDEALEPDARVHDHAHFFIFTHEYAALGLLGGIACVDANPGEARHAEKQRQPLLEAHRLGHY